MKRLYILLLFPFLASGVLHAKENILIDNASIQEYQGRFGKWIHINSPHTVKTACRDYSVTLNEVYSLNRLSKNARVVGKYLFIPYGETYLEQLRSRGITRSTIQSAEDEFIWPIENVTNISSVLGFRGRRFHTGMDIPASRGTEIKASMGGRVIYSGYMSGYGNTIEIEHRNNFITRYSHNAANFAKKDDFVKKGQVIAVVGSTGNSTGNHLHFEIRCIEVPLDPLDFLPRREDIKMPQTLKNWK
ncbi:MAG TPA: M23 family metallopeptidase [Spirochaetes bacterium]|nr:M23 family metallopeptidase [Spirochaetota bacterium]